MNSFLRSAFVIGRRDFVATVYSRTFLLFLLGPLLIIGLSIVLGNATERMARDDLRARVAVIASEAEFTPIAAARERLNPSFGERELPELVRVEQDYEVEGQVQDLLASSDRRFLGVLTGGLARPKLTGAVSETGTIRSQMALILNEATQQRALRQAGADDRPVELQFVKVDESAGSLASLRALTARSGQLLLFMLTVLLAGMLLSNLIEEKSNKVIEILAASAPVDAIFMGKLFAMLAVSLVGIAVWTAGALLGLALFPTGSSLPEPAVGWPFFVILVILYYSANYLLLGALFLGIGSQASSVREVQTLSMPVTVGQILVFMFASFAVGPFNGILGIAAAVFPFSSPLAMIARAAQTPELWTHLLALAWQALWVWLTIKLGASLFRSNVMKSGAGRAMSSMLRARRS